MVVVRKRDSSIRLCLDLRRVNDLTWKNTVLLPRVDDCLDAFRDNIWLSTLDLDSGYNQVAMDNDDAVKNAFVTTKGLFEFKRMPFG